MNELPDKSASFVEHRGDVVCLAGSIAAEEPRITQMGRALAVILLLYS
jgi:hypothetical protein